MTRRRTRIAATTAALTTLAFAAAPAEAGEQVKSKLTIEKLRATGASGEVNSKANKCEKRRRVTLKYVGEYGPVTIGRDTTDRKGNWKVDKRLDERGLYYARVAKKATTIDGEDVTCKADASPDKRL